MTDMSRVRQYLNLPMNLDFVGGRLEHLAGDASSRVYIRVRGDDDRSMILTVYPEPFDDRETALQRFDRLCAIDPDLPLRWANDPLAQLAVHQIFVEGGVPVPALAGIDGSTGIVAFEDLGDKRLAERLDEYSPGAAGEPQRRAAYEEAVALLAQIHNSTHFVTETDHISARLRFSSAKFLWELDFFLTHYFGSFQKSSLTPGARQSSLDALEPLCSSLAQRPTVLTHRDYHVRNLMVHDGRLLVIDYQDARLGPRTYDLVSLLLDPYVPEGSIPVEALRNTYCERVGISWNDALEEEWTAMAIQRLLKAAGTYAFMASVREKAHFQQWLFPTLRHARRLMRQRGGLDGLLWLLRDIPDA